MIKARGRPSHSVTECTGRGRAARKRQIDSNSRASTSRNRIGKTPLRNPSGNVIAVRLWLTHMCSVAFSIGFETRYIFSVSTGLTPQPCGIVGSSKHSNCQSVRMGVRVFDLELPLVQAKYHNPTRTMARPRTANDSKHAPQP